MYKKNAQGWLKHIDFILLDMFMLQASYVLGYMLRHGWGNWPYQRPDYYSLAIVLLVVDMLVSEMFNTMHNVLRRGLWQETKHSLQQTLLVLVIMSLYMFSTHEGGTFSRITIYLTSAFHLAFGFCSRLVWKTFLRSLNQGKEKNAMILVADEKVALRVLQNTSKLDDAEYVGIIYINRDGTGEDVGGIKVVASLENAADFICREWVDEVFVCTDRLAALETSSADGTEESGPGDALAFLVEKCREMAITVHIRIPVSAAGGKNFVEKVGGYNVWTMTANYATPLQLFLKRMLDIAGGLVGSVAALILIAVIGPKIKRESPGPVLFKQTRIGQNGKRFTFYKIRSMYMDAEARKQDLMEQNRVADGMMFKLDFDPRIIGNKIIDGKQVTGIGEKLRSTSLDEFPQFFNVLRGDMSLVGTRPPTEDEWEKYKYHHRARLAAKPGLTGMWQVSGRSQITDFEEVVKLDTEYINNWSMALDLKILFKTIGAVRRREGAM